MLRPSIRRQNIRWMALRADKAFEKQLFQRRFALGGNVGVRAAALS